MEAALAPPRFPAVILAGGKSSRMGEPKALLPFGQGRLIDHVAARLTPQVTVIALNANDPSITLPGILSFPDRFADHPGPLAGIHAGLAHIRENAPDATHVLMVPVDGPFFPTNLVDTLTTTLSGPADIALTASGGRMHPVLGLWPVSLTDRLADWLKAPPTLKVRAFLAGLPVHVTEFALMETPFGPLDPFFNINTRDDLDRARKMLEVAIN
ncbi:molybdenum cofactor guanylyltransferase [Rhizobium sp. TH2]|uniref:molybdenum cofactor guanylyltransferase MobA n=1 Tax=Rhizobium sp. TH2 TaxID=2775403 RepID=UPI002157D3A3|nr:molybdenum cofactor guanylyltransferase MobA [Rhizobium sp. TH2]UVC11498.1 molybdenum cofactor guanylyltransferase [Rhizobium sp. TH2]